MQHSPSSKRLVLVVEDETMLLTTTCDMLEDEGFEVLAAPDADAAINLLGSHGDEVGVLFTDVRMPGSMDGLELSRVVRERWPHIRILVTSGHIRAGSSALAGSRFVSKPYRLTQVSALLRQAMSEAAGDTEGAAAAVLQRAVASAR